MYRNFFVLSLFFIHLSVNVQAQHTANVSVTSGKNVAPKTYTKAITVSKNITKVKDSFYFAPLQVWHKIYLYLPNGYTPTKRYPVLYMHDGQNLFDNATSYSGEWEVDEYMDKTNTQCIVVGITNAGSGRMQQYNPYPWGKELNTYGDAAKSMTATIPYGKEYAAFLVTTIKPYIDANYSTKRSRANTYLAGSSMGGLISYYTALKYPNVFSKVGIFSPSFWINMDAIKQQLSYTKKGSKMNYYFYAGSIESKNLVAEVMDIYTLTKSKTKKANMQLHIKAQAQHNEASWSAEFPEFMKWISK